MESSSNGVAVFKLAAMAGVIVISLAGGFLPLCLRGISEKRRNDISELSKYFTAGVFLGVGLLHMLPEAAEGISSAGFDTLPGGRSFPLAYAACALGVILVWSLERHVASFGEQGRIVAVAAGADHRGGGTICYVQVQPVSSYGPVVCTPAGTLAVPAVAMFRDGSGNVLGSGPEGYLPLAPGMEDLLLNQGEPQGPLEGAQGSGPPPRLALEAAAGSMDSSGESGPAGGISSEEEPEWMVNGFGDGPGAGPTPPPHHHPPPQDGCDIEVVVEGMEAASSAARGAAPAGAQGSDGLDGGGNASPPVRWAGGPPAAVGNPRGPFCRTDSANSEASFLSADGASLAESFSVSGELPWEEAGGGGGGGGGGPLPAARQWDHRSLSLPVTLYDADGPAAAAAAAEAPPGDQLTPPSHAPALLPKPKARAKYTPRLEPLRSFQNPRTNPYLHDLLTHHACELPPAPPPPPPGAGSGSLHTGPYQPTRRAHKGQDRSRDRSSAAAAAKGPAGGGRGGDSHAWAHCGGDAGGSPRDECHALHGHTHVVEHHHVVLGGGGGFMPFLLAGLFSLHSFVVGAALGTERQLDGALSLLIALLAHKGAEAFAVGIQFVRERVPLKKTVAVLLLYCAMTPLGIAAGMGVALLRGPGGILVTCLTQSFGAGTVIYIVMLQLGGQAKQETFGELLQLFLFLVGLAIMAAVSVFT